VIENLLVSITPAFFALRLIWVAGIAFNRESQN